MHNVCVLCRRVHLPVAYHGRSSSIIVSGTPVQRPWYVTHLSGFCTNCMWLAASNCAAAFVTVHSPAGASSWMRMASLCASPVSAWTLSWKWSALLCDRHLTPWDHLATHCASGKVRLYSHSCGTSRTIQHESQLLATLLTRCISANTENCACNEESKVLSPSCGHHD